MKTRISIVVPCYNEAEVIETTIDRLAALVRDNRRYDFELLFVDDGSRDRTPEILRRAARSDPAIWVLYFARNFGHQIAVTAGIDAASGAAVVLMDADLQGPPETVAAMIAKWEDGYDVVYGTRISRQGESAFKISSARAFYRVLNRLSEVPIPLDTGDFRLMSRPVVEVLKSMPERHRFVRGAPSHGGESHESREIGRYLAAQAYDMASVMHWGAEPGVYFWTRQPTHFKYPFNYPLFHGPRQEQMRREVIDQIRCKAPKLIVVTRAEIGDQNEVMAFIARYYEKSGDFPSHEFFEFWTQTGPLPAC